VVELLAHRVLYTLIMLHRLRIVFVCLLALALPVQGFAAATMLFCAGDHHHGAVAPGASSAMGSDHADLATTAAHLPVHSQNAASPHDQHASNAGPHSPGKSLAKVDGKCSACSACCTSVALPSALMAFQPVKADAPLVASVTRALVGFLPDGQDRPPRTFLA